MKIRFGTDGWRGVIADNFTFENVSLVANAMASYIGEQAGESPVITVGYDTRFHSSTFARLIADILARRGCNVLLSDKCLSTPALSSSVVDHQAFAGIMVSASHNPPEFNGIKFKTAEGSSASEEVTRQIEKCIELFSKYLAGNSRRLPAGYCVAPRLCAAAGTPHSLRLASDRNSTPLSRRCISKSVLGKSGDGKPGKGSLKTGDLTRSYLRRLKGTVDFHAIKGKRLKIIADPMYGAGIGYLDTLLKGTSNEVMNIHSHPDPLFGGLHPEPIESQLNDLKRTILKTGSQAGLATDGDADRVGVIDEKGRYLTPHQVFPLLLYYLCHYKRMKGKVVQAISLGYLSERISRDYGLPFEEVPIGFKHIAERIIKEEILVGGEESGGYGYGTYLPERDGILNSLMIVEMLATTGKPLSALISEIEKKYGISKYLRTDFANPGIPKEEFIEKIRRSIPSKISGLKIVNVKDYDGIEFILEDDSWLLLRPSGTEPIIRVYAESENIEKTRGIIKWGQQITSKLVKT